MNGLGLTTPMPTCSSQSGRPARQGKRHRQAFTLVELLVVIVIIGILIALLVPTIGSALTAARNAEMALELSNIAQAVEKYRMDIGAYPPDFANPDPLVDTQQMTTHLARKFRYRNPQDQSSLNIQGLDPAEALVFWLSGFSKDPKFPLARREALDPTDVNSRPIKSEAPFFEFDQSRLIDKDGDGYPEYYPANSEAPFVYIRHDNYGVEGSDGSFVANAIPILNGNLAPVYAYAVELATGASVKRFSEAEKYQILCAGMDSEFGPGLAVFPDGLGYAEADEDNITNFSGGKTLQDSIP